jgi:protein O-GlcNAc transferase
MLGRLNDAGASYRMALQIKPDLADAHYDLGNTLHELGQLDEAEASYRRALENKPDFAEVYSNFGITLKTLGRLDEAEACYRQALRIKPDLAEAHNNLGIVLKDMCRLDEAAVSYHNAYQLGMYGARIKAAFMLPAIMGTRQEAMASRAKFEQNLDELIAEKGVLDAPLTSIGETNFYLAYHGVNDRDLQVKVAKYYEQACPSLLYTAPHCLKPKPEIRKKIRVGFLSKFLYNHSVSLCFSKIIETLSLNEQFDIALISEHPVDETIYSEFAGKHVRLPNNLVQAREILSALELDILLYLDIGMEPLSYFLAFSRLARAQCVLTGHPVTTGITNIDYFLSSDLMEPAAADEHYSEQLVRLPMPVFYFARPILPTTLKTRNELGLPEGQHVYMCPMKLQKIHPDFDEAITRILQLDHNGVVVLFEDGTWPYWKESIVKRFESTIPEAFLERIIFLPWLKNTNDFISAIATADVILDPFHFGIGSTAATTSITGTPLVTKPGEFMRGRVGAYFCEMLDMAECITKDTEGYAKKAVEIAVDPILRKKISAKMLKNNSALYDNLQSADDLADFFRSLTD